MDIPTYIAWTNSAPIAPNCHQQEEKMNRIPRYIVIPDSASITPSTREIPCSLSSHLFSPSNERWSSNGACSVCPPSLPHRGSANSLPSLRRKDNNSSKHAVSRTAARLPLRRGAA